MISGKVVDLVQIIHNKHIPGGPGSVRLTDRDAFVLIMLYSREPSTTLRGCQLRLYHTTGDDRLSSNNLQLLH